MSARMRWCSEPQAAASSQLQPSASSVMHRAKRRRDRVARDDGGRPRPACVRAPRRSRPLPPLAKIQASRMASPRLPASVGWSASSETKSAGAPAAMPAGPAPSACAPPCSAASNSRAAGRAAGRGQARCARGRASRCEYSSWRSSSATPISTLESEPMPKRPPCVEEAAAVEDAVAEIGFGDRAKAGDRAARGQAGRSRPRSCGWRGSGTSAGRRGVGEQPFDRPRARPGEAILDLLHLLGDMDVDRAVRRQRSRRRASSSGVTARRLCGATPTTAPSSRRNRARGFPRAGARSDRDR